MSARRIVLVAGEASGDNLGAGLIQALRQQWPDAEFAGIGGKAMRAAGCETWFDAEALAVMGLVEILRHLPRLLRLRRQLRTRVLAWKPDVFIGIDAPEFNLGVERWLKKRGIRTMHYVSPSVWAWRRKRAKNMARCADQVLCLFPMEPPIYADYGVNARFVGHPLADTIALENNAHAARAALHLPPTAPILAVLPGSRRGEVSRLIPAFLQAAQQAAAQLPSLHIVIPAANDTCKALITQAIRDYHITNISLHLLDGRAREAMTAADVVLLASGTATLEAMLLKRPMVVAYRVAELTYRIVKALRLIKIDRYALPNVLAGRDLVPEYIQHQCTAEALSAAVVDWFKQPQRLPALQHDYLHLHHRLRQQASTCAAIAVRELLESPPQAH